MLQRGVVSLCLALHGDQGSRGTKREETALQQGSQCKRQRWQQLEPLPEGSPSEQGFS